MQDSPEQQRAWLQQMNAGKQSFQRGDLSAAARAFTRATELLPTRAEGWVNLGSSLLQGRAYPDSAKALQTALALDPALAAGHMLLGDAQRLLGQAQPSLASYRQAVALQRSPMALNKLACALRARLQAAEAEALYREALDTAPNFTVARVNLATLQLETGNYAAAAQQLTALEGVKLPGAERAEVTSARLALAEYRRLHGVVDSLGDDADLQPLVDLLRELPKPARRVDEKALEPARRYLQWAAKVRPPDSPQLVELPPQWLLVEALFMVPLVNTVDEYRELRASLDCQPPMTDELRASLNMQPVINAARDCRDRLRDPPQAEAHLRHWHALACRDAPGYTPGHFKYTRNWSAEAPNLKRVEPPMASATLQHFMGEMYPRLQAGPIRAAVTFMVLCDLHCFADGNGRLAVTWLNRELEWSGLMPALFRRDLGRAGELGRAMHEARGAGGDLSPLLAVIVSAQRYALEFCNALATDA